MLDQSIGFGVATALREAPGYERSKLEGFWPRTSHAIRSTLVSKRTDGGRGPAYSRFAGAYGSAFIANSWHPAPSNGGGRALKCGSISLGFDVGKNVFKEFWPDIKRRFGRK